MSFHVTIDAFDGPLDLMLHLIKDKKLDLFNLDISVLTDQYLKYLNHMEILKLEIASEYLAELASLIEYKSRKLLPKDETELTDAYEEDPREKLVRRLIEYQKFKEITPLLETRLEERSMHYTKPQSEIPAQWISEEALPSSMNVYDLLKSVQKMFQRIALQQPLQSKITYKEISVDDRVVWLRHMIYTSEIRQFQLQELLISSTTMQELVITFLALLDMARNSELHFKVQEDEIFICKGEYKHEESLA